MNRTSSYPRERRLASCLLCATMAVMAAGHAADCVSPPPGLVSLWSAEGSGSGTALLHDAVLSGGLTFASGEIGQAFDFNGVDASISVAASPALDVGTGEGLTIEGWIRPRDASRLQPLVEWNNGRGEYGTHLWLALPEEFGGSGPGSFFANLFDNGSHVIESAGGIIVADRFQHVALTYDAATGMASLYHDGVMVATEALGTFTPQTTYDLYLGRRPSGDPRVSFGGRLDEMSLYNRALSAEEIQIIYRARSATKCPEAPTILIQPIRQTVTLGRAAAFAVKATGSFPLSYQWLLNGTEIPGATNEVLEVTDAQAGAEGLYSVVAANEFGSVTSSEALLTVRVPVCSQPAAGLVAWWSGEGSVEDYNGSANGTLHGPVSLVPSIVGPGFFLDGKGASVRIPAAPNLDVGSSEGLTIELWVNPSDVSTPRPLVEWNDGTGPGVHFWISLPESTGGGPGSLFANLVDTSGNSHSIQSPAALLLPDEFQHMALTYDRPSGVASLYWNGAKVAEETIGILRPQTSSTLYVGERPARHVMPAITFAGILDEVTLYDRALAAAEIEAVYEADAQGKCAAPPMVTTALRDQTVSAGTNVTLSVSANGTSPLSYRWQFNDIDLIESSLPSLTLTNVQAAHVGDYRVIVTDPFGGNDVSSVAHLTVNPTPPSVIQQPASQATFVASTVIFQVQATGSEPFTYQWLFNGVPIAGATDSELTLTNVQEEDAGAYSVIVSNEAGSVTSAVAQLTVDSELWSGAFFAPGFAAAALPQFAPETLLVLEDGMLLTASGQIYRLTSNGWQPFLEDRFNGAINSMASDGKNLWVGGSFTAVGNVSAAGIAQWDGTNWTALGTGVVVNEPNRASVYAMTVRGTDLYVGGFFSMAGDVATRGVVRWDGQRWHDLAGGVRAERETGTVVNALHAYGDDLIVAGEFASAGGVQVTNVARWNATGWHAMGSAVGFEASSLAVDQQENLYAGGGGVYRWDGVEWRPLGSEGNQPQVGLVRAVAHFQGELYAGGTDASRWDGESWHPVDLSIGGILSMTATADRLYTTGTFLSTPVTPRDPGVTVYDGAYSTPVGFGIHRNGGWNHVNSAVVLDGNLYLAGLFRGLGDSEPDLVVKWDGKKWTDLGLRGPSLFTSETYSTGTDGQFVYVGGVVSGQTGVFKWDGSAWELLGTNLPPATAILATGDEIYAGGGFGVARYDGDQWVPLGELPTGYVVSLCFHGDTLIAGGDFESADEGTINYLASWDGSQWNPLRSGVDGPVRVLVSRDSLLYAGGDFNRSGDTDLSHIGVWDGVNWRAIGGGFSRGIGVPVAVDEAATTVKALVFAEDGTLFAGGNFTRAADIDANHIARWDGDRWHNLGSGMSDSVTTLSIAGDILYACGAFSRVGGKQSSLIAAWHGLNGKSSDADFKLEPIGLSSNGTFQFRVIAPANSAGTIETSEDLRAWSDIAQFSGEENGFSYTDPESGSKRHRYYRARIQIQNE